MLRLAQTSTVNSRSFFKTLLVAAISFLAVRQSAAYYNMNFGFKVRSPSLSFTTSAQTILSSLCSGVMTVQTRNAAGVATNVGSNLTVNLSGASGVTFYSDSSCLNGITTVTVSSGTNSSSFYFVSTSTGSKSITASASNYTNASQTETINTNGYIWTGGGANANWATSGNWSGGAAPGSGNVAVFDGTCASNCSPTIAANISVAGIRILNAYAGTITQNAGVTIAVGASGWNQSGGTFSGGTSTISISQGDMRITAGTFNPGTSTVVFDMGVPSNKTYTIDVGSNPFYNLTLRGAGYNGGLIVVSSNLIVNGTLQVDDPYPGYNKINGGPILAYGDVTAANNGHYGTAVIKMVGTGNSTRTLTGSSTANLGNFEIAACAGCTVNFSGSLYFEMANFTYTSGIVNAGTSTFIFDMNVPTNTTYTLNAGTMAFNNLTLRGGEYNGGIISVSSNLSVNGTLVLDNPHPGTNRINGGPILAYGDVSVGANNGRLGTAVVKMVGTGNSTHTLTGTSSANIGNFEIAACAGCTVNFSGSIHLVASNFTYTSGIISAGTSTFIFDTQANATSYTMSGSMTFNNFTLTGAGYNGAVAVFASPQTISGTLTLTDPAGGRLNYSGTLIAQGDVSLTGNGVEGSGILTVSGGSDTALSQSGTAGAYNGDWTISKGAGNSVTLSSNLVLSRSGHSLSVSSGTLNMNGKNLSLPGTLTIAAGATVACNGGTLSYGSLVNNGTLNCP